MIRILIPIAALAWTTLAIAAAPQYALQVEGLACPFCAYGIEKQLKKLEGVDQVAVDLEQGRVTVRMAEGAQLTEVQARSATEKSGFTLRGFQAVETVP